IIVNYKKSVNIRNMINYFIFTPPMQYEIFSTQKRMIQWKTFMKLLVQLMFLYFMTAFILLQFILPEMLILKNEINDNIVLLGIVFRIMLAANLVWMVSMYLNVYETYLPAYAALCGLPQTFCKDWWNSETLTVFWRRWNLPVHNCLKYNVALPLIRCGYSQSASNFIVFAVAGIIHEYLNTFPFGIYNGMAFVFTLLEIPAGYLNVCITKKFGNVYGNLFLWMYLIFTHCLAIISTFLFHVPHN
ncbi:hypothetical protein ILUMI_27557, partial [Ignelater luminosus]